MKAFSSVLLLCVTLFGLSAHAVQADCPLKNLRKSGLLLTDQRTNFVKVVQQNTDSNSGSVNSVNSSN